MEQLTTENAPLFLALEITKKTAKMVYVDTPDHSAEKIFRRQGLTFKRLNERTSDDSRYIFVGCRISRRDTEVFRKASYPWYDWVNYGDANRGMLSEDLYFCSLCRASGIPIYADVRVGCGHLLRHVQWPD